MKKEIRILGIDDSPFDKFKDKEVLVIGAFYKGGIWLDGILSTKAKVDGSDSTDKLLEMINQSKFKAQIRAVLINGIAFGGFNVIDIVKLNKKTRIPIIVIIRKMPDIENIKKVLTKLGMKDKIRLIEKAGIPVKIGKIYCQFSGCSVNFVKEVLRISCTRSFIPEPIRIAHVIGAGIIDGESHGDA